MFLQAINFGFAIEWQEAENETDKGKKIRFWIGSGIMMSVMIVSLVTGLKVQAAADSGKIALNKTSISVKKGITEKITVKNKPAGAKIFWSSKNKKIAKVKNGVVTGRKQGKTVVTCKVVYQKGQKKVIKKFKATVTVGNNKQVILSISLYTFSSRNL